MEHTPSLGFWVLLAGLIADVVIAILAFLITRRGADPEAEKTRERILKRWLEFIAIFACIAVALGVILERRESVALETRIAIVTRMAASNDLRNLPVSDIVGKASVELSGRLDGTPQPPMPIDLESSLMLMESNAPPNTLSFGAFQNLYVSGVMAHETRSTGPITHGYSINFRHDFGHSGGAVAVISNGAPATARIVTDRINWTQLRLAFVPPKSEVLGGSVEILINGTFPMPFTIPPQICSTNGTFYATNSTR